MSAKSTAGRATPADDEPRELGAQPTGLRCRGLRARFGDTTVLDGVDLQVARGGSVAVMGPSGSGKTTLLNAVAGLCTIAEGDIHIDDLHVSAMSERARARMRLRHIGMVFQFGELLPELSVLENVSLPLRLRGVRRDDEAEAMLGVLGLAGRKDSWPGELSGGETQRVAIARALVGSPAVILADEPSGALDEDLSQVVCDLLVSSARDVNAVLVVATHDPAVAGAMDVRTRLRRGKLEHA